jgi:hypothetical protein
MIGSDQTEIDGGRQLDGCPWARWSPHRVCDHFQRRNPGPLDFLPLDDQAERTMIAELRLAP